MTSFVNWGNEEQEFLVFADKSSIVWDIYNEMPSFEVLSIRHVKMGTDRGTAHPWVPVGLGVMIPANDDAISPSFEAYRLWTVSSYVC